MHELELTAFIDHLAKNGYSDFLIDIGANIGLTSCQNGIGFKEIHMFEPNPFCCQILEVNCKLKLNSINYFIHKFGLGEEDKKAELTVLNNNWGAAYIADKLNAYDESTLAHKDGFKRLNKQNYSTVDIPIKNSVIELKKIFDELSIKGLNNGVIKIDVEGYEPVVLRGIAETFPQHMRAHIIFESHSRKFDMTDIIRVFRGRATIGKLYRNTPYKKNWPNFLKLASLILNLKISTTLQTIQDGDYTGDIVLKID